MFGPQPRSTHLRCRKGGSRTHTSVACSDSDVCVCARRRQERHRHGAQTPPLVSCSQSREEVHCRKTFSKQTQTLHLPDVPFLLHRICCPFFMHHNVRKGASVPMTNASARSAPATCAILYRWPRPRQRGVQEYRRDHSPDPRANIGPQARLSRVLGATSSHAASSDWTLQENVVQ